jgi:hypothetical protein
MFSFSALRKFFSRMQKLSSSAEDNFAAGIEFTKTPI